MTNNLNQCKFTVKTRDKLQLIIYPCIGARSERQVKGHVSNSSSIFYFPLSIRPTSRRVRAQDEDSTKTDVAEVGEAGELQGSEELQEKGGSLGTAEDVGKALSELRKERLSGSQDSASETGFWRGVAEETQLIEWPIFSKVLGTTGVVMAMIIGSSVVLLTVNAILSAGSDFLFNDLTIPGFTRMQ